MTRDGAIFAIRNEDAQKRAAPEKMTVLVVEPGKEPYLKEIAPGLHSLQAEVAATLPPPIPSLTRWGWSATMRASSSAWS